MVLSMVLMICIVVTSAWLASRHAEQQIRQDTGKTLAVVTSLTHQAVLTWAHENQGTAEIWAHDAEVVKLTKQLLSLSRQNSELLRSSPIHQRLRQHLDPVIQALHFAGYFVISPDNISISSMRDKNIGMQNLLAIQGALLLRAWSGETVISLPQKSDVPLNDADGVLRKDLPTQFVVSPIIDSNSEVIALLAFRIDPRGELASILEKAIWGFTGETFVFDREARLLSKSRHEDRIRARGILATDQPFIFNVTLTNPDAPGTYTVLAKQALANDNVTSGVIVDGYTDYSGVAVMGAWQWDPDLNIGLATEIDEAEALRELGVTRAVIYGMASLLVSSVVLMFYLQIWASRKLVKEQYRFRQLADKAYDMISRHDASGVYYYASPACIRLLGYQQEELVGRSVYEFIHPDDIAIVNTIHQQVMAENGYESSYRIRHKDGHFVWFETTSNAERNEDGAVNEIIAISRDVTQRKLAEDALKESELRYRALVDNLEEGLVVHNPKGEIVTVNPKALDILGLTEDQIMGRTSFDKNWHTIREDGSPFLPEEHPASISLKTGLSQSQVEMGVYRPDGALSWISINSRAVLDKKQLRYVIVTFRDITQLRKAERAQEQLQRQLQRSQKMEALGQLTGGIAHDFNNILCAIQGYTELLLMLKKEGEKDVVQNYLLQIQQATQRASSLISKLLLFSRNQPGKPIPTRAEAVVKEVVEMLKPTFPTTMSLKVGAAPDLPLIMIDQTQLHQLVANLCINARDAMEGRGELSITLDIVNVTGLVCSSCNALISGQWLVLDVCDTGPGISPELLTKIFEPFFTTKEVGKGTGMGLSMVHGIVHDYHGHIVVTSILNKGTIFRLLLPIYETS